MTPEEAVKFYGADAAEWLRRWDAGQSVWSIEMGGLGPGYEQCIHVTCAEILRYWLTHGDIGYEETMKHIDQDETVRKLRGISGAQAGAAYNLAGHLYKHGPAKVMADEAVKDRHIQVSRHFPGS